jgi:hypothetical protein
MRRVALTLLVVVFACGPMAGTSGHVSKSSASRLTSPSQGVVTFSCRLPVVWSPYQPGSAQPENEWGFVTFPGATISVEANPLPKAVPFQIGWWPGLSYDRAVGHWLPVSRNAVSPDGFRYVYAEYDPAGPSDDKAVHANSGRVHIVDVRSGLDRVIFTGSPSFGVVNLSADTVYLTQVGYGYVPTARGLYRLDPNGGVPQLMSGADRQTDPGSWTLVGQDAGWAVDFASGGVDRMGGGNELIRHDLRTNATEVWMTTATNNVLWIVGIDTAGHPIVVTGPYSTTSPETDDLVVSLVTAVGTSTKIREGPDAPGNSGVVDKHGVWMSGVQAVWLYQQDGSLLRFSVSTGGQYASPIAVGGACI